MERLQAVGKWLDANGEALYGTQASPFPRPLPWGRVTRRGNTLYCVVFEDGKSAIALPGLKTPILSATLLEDSNPVEVQSVGGVQGLVLPKAAHKPIYGSGYIPPGTDPSLGYYPVIKVQLAGEPIIEKTLPGQNLDGSITLAAQDAEVQGNSARYEDDKKAIGFWTDANDVVSWTFEVTKPGTFRVVASVACDKDSNGTLASLFYEREERQFVVNDTGGWDKFKDIEVGTITINKLGPAKVSIKARMKPGYAVMNLRSVKLVSNAR